MGDDIQLPQRHSSFSATWGGVNKRSEAMKRMRRNHEAAFKTQMAFAEVTGDKALAEWAGQFGVASIQ